MQDAIALNDELTVMSCQVTPGQLRQTVQAGFHSVLNLRAPEEPGFMADERSQAKAVGLHYKNIPIEPATLDDESIRQVLATIEGLPKPAVLHCASGMRAGLMASLYVATQQGLVADQTVTMARNLGLKWPLQPALQQICERVCG